MELKLDIPFKQLLELVRQLPPSQKKKLQKELVAEVPQTINNSLKEFLLTGPVFSEEQIKTIEDTRKSINEWRIK